MWGQNLNGQPAMQQQAMQQLAQQAQQAQAQIAAHQQAQAPQFQPQVQQSNPQMQQFQQPQFQQQLVQQPQFSLPDPVPTSQLDVSGLDQYLNPDVAPLIMSDLQKQQVAVQQYYAQQQAQVEQHYTAQLAQERALVEQLQTELANLIRQVTPAEQRGVVDERLRLAEQQRQLEAERNQLRPVAEQQKRAAALQSMAVQWNIPVEVLATATSPSHATELALAYERRRSAQVPANQMNIGPSGNGGGSSQPIPRPDSPEFRQMMEQTAKTGRPAWR